MKVNDIKETLEDFENLRKSNHRYSSFDYCYNYFLNTHNLNEDIEKSCLELAFYLASWGMFRGSSFLLQKSARHFQETIEYIDSIERKVWKIDVNNYNETNLETLIDIYNNLDKKLEIGKSRSITLVTKTMMGVFGITPAFDKYFCDTFKNISLGKCNFNSFNINSLNIIKEFYDNNKNIIDDYSKKTHTLDFDGKKSNINYTKAKIIDMYAFEKGISKDKRGKLIIYNKIKKRKKG